MGSEDRQERLRRERAGGGESFHDVLRRVVRRPSVLVKVLAVALPLAVVGIVFVPAPFAIVPIGLVGIPVMAWMMGRDRKGSPSPSDCDPVEDP
ncbi:hypothetical protein [Streptomyces sp. RKAG293]|uniref:hypothetical protein n=1 Tax=Streptomyces sp. RKAG293 TaxID=2893403 RepID=UPI0020335112|nr:hypothetical protein [Streptomyces sp. RKAG293]MCM2421654.1 hypothetical protein [Streptomyces sp. RKAG293]